ncbi:aminoacyl-tRNA hydrolase [Brevibacterium jeotgali]|uniref:Peptidyl-tRNA hydrolase n=1 Tax=Brevibacterium jeotgali TaxID=1262550 RepID=A0A2H1L6C8_9MICO|nr:aminoacyl-tRNA hydrolase [Brevibacterium jeotgali]TWB99029.1 PTH1 family peptidyl-tRNA hydrolase [Brevibacterium jeotgali]SMY12464.1 peptidyl-tRNA hydrolase [Brevibacterium jeotgali]
MAADTWILVGLGNPGSRYEATRHNIGYLVVDELLRRMGATLTRSKTRALAATGRLPGAGGLPGPRAVLVRPSTYMNESGQPVGQLARFHSVAPDRIIAIHDDVDLDYDSVRLKKGGGEGGHNGLRSLTSHLGTKDYLRVRAGVGRPRGRMETSDHVLGRFTAEERATLPIFVSDLADAVEAVALEGLESAQQRFHAPR